MKRGTFIQDLSQVNEEREPLTLLGLCIWDIFSNNHSVIDISGKEYDLGSFRGSASFIADFLSGANKKKDKVLNFDYVEFYLGTIWIKNRGDLSPFYEYVFTVLKKENCDWKYSFPRLDIINFNREEPSTPESYDPLKAMEHELENKKVDELKQKFEDIYKEEYEEAKYKQPTKTVLAYQKIFGVLPDGHPQKEL